ncbi:MAG: DpnD/PcfM family protein [Megamonas funiformis]|uniref:DpnD/PcfM family protein n=1 Tax=Megamonas funiformis TaxID=437897 RepID=UPI002A8270D5|nr:DpnD/PcfM family protein [Megamonas funiformis]MDY3873937.1 DpnD/PcfM family protein [Megamonas funiformis]
MEKYTITIEETVSEVFYLEANSLEEAKELAIENYNNSVFVLEPGNLIETNVLVENDKENSGWFEL